MPEGVAQHSGRTPWDGRTYYGRPQLKPAPFNAALVGTYIFLAGLSGGAQLLATLIDRTRGSEAAPVVRRGRYLSLLAPLLGSICLVMDLHTPQRFYNMLRVAKATSPMSFGAWLLAAFGGLSAMTGAMQFMADRVPGFDWLRRVTRVSGTPAAVAGVGLGTYTASLLSATSTPLWAAAPASLAIRFGASSIASAAAALGIGEGRSRLGRDLDTVAVAALALELAATLAGDAEYQRAGVNVAQGDGPPAEQALGAVLPMGLLLGSLVFARSRCTLLTGAASLAVLGGSLAMRIRVLAEGNRSAARPDISMRFAQPTEPNPARR